MRLQDLLIGLLIFAMFMIVLLGFAYSTYNRMGVTIDNQTQQVFRTFEISANKTSTDMFGNTLEMQNKSIGGAGVSADTSKTYSENVLGSGVNVLLVASRSFDIFSDTVRTIGNGWGVAEIITATLISIVIIIVVILFASSILQNRL